jgi:hypothetical protein
MPPLVKATGRARNQMGQCGVRAVKMAMPLVSNNAQFFPAVGCLAGANLPTPRMERSQKAIGVCLTGAPVHGQEVLAAVLRVRAQV